MDAHKDALLKKPINQLRELAAVFDPPIELGKIDTRKVIVKKILAREEQEASSSPKAGPDDIGPARPAFEQAAAEVVGGESTERRGGPRPGAGRPLGMTDEKAKARNLPQVSNATINKAIFLAGQAWAQSVEIPAVAFDEKETELLALPVTQIQERYFPGIIPEMGHAFVALLYGIHQLVITRLILIKEVQAARKAGRGKEVEAVVNKPKEDSEVKLDGQTG